MKKIVAALLAPALLAGSCTVAWADTPEIYYNGSPLSLEAPAVLRDGRTLLSLRDVGEGLGVDVAWDAGTRLATVTYRDNVIVLQPDLGRVLLNGVPQEIDVGPQILDGHIYLPLRYLFELLDGDVFYRQYGDGTAIVSVNARDSYINYIRTRGQLTTAVRSAEGSPAGHTVLMTHDGNVLEAYLDVDQIRLRRTTKTFRRVEQYQEPVLFYSGITDVLESDGQYYAVLDETQRPEYIGRGYHPTGSAFLRDIPTPQGNFDFYGCETQVNTFALESNEGFGYQVVRGYLLDTSKSVESIRSADYAFDGSGNCGFLTDGQLLLIANDAAQGYHVTRCTSVSDTLRTGRIFHWDGVFYVLGSDRTAEGQTELFSTAYTAQGLCAHAYLPVSDLASAGDYRYMDIRDAVQIGDQVYLLLQSDRDRRLACYDLSTRSFRSEVLDLPYEKFVPAKGGWQLYYCDGQTYYFLALE